jgi:hypothetical protein
MESEFLDALKRWQDDWTGVIKRLTIFRDSLAELQFGGDYVDSPAADQHALDRAISAFDPVLELYGYCFNTMLSFLGGVLCFACEPRWQSIVFRDNTTSDSPLGYHVHPASYDAVGHSCQVWSGFVRELRIRVQDSRLAKLLPIPFEHLRRFETKANLGTYLHNCGLRAFDPRGRSAQIAVGPSNDHEATGKAAPANVSRRLDDRIGRASADDSSQVEWKTPPPRTVDVVALAQSSMFNSRVFPVRPEAIAIAFAPVLACVLF